MNTLDGVYILLQKGVPLLWKQKGQDGEEVAGLVIALNHYDAKRLSQQWSEKYQMKISPYLVGSATENFNLSVTEFYAHIKGEELDVVFVLHYEEDRPKFWFVPPDQLTEFLKGQNG